MTRFQLWALTVGGTALVLAAGLGGYKLRSIREAEAYKAMIREKGLNPTQSSAYRHRSDHFKQLPDGPRVVMLGDSLVGAGQWNELIGPTVVNRGVPGDTSAGVLARLDESVPKSTAVVFLMIGVNDLDEYDVPPAKVAANTAEIVRRLAPRRVVVQSVLYTRRPALNLLVKELDALNRATCATGVCEYVDLNPVIAPGGVIDRRLTYDGLHVNGVGYERWAAAIRPLMAQELSAE